MNPIAILKQVEADVKSFGSISGEIRAKLKSGVADLTAIRDEMSALVETVMGKATAALTSLRTVADEVSKDASDTTPTAPIVTTPAPGVTVTVDTTAGTTSHADATTGVTTTVDHASGEATATAAGTAVPANAADVATAIAATAEAGVAIPPQG